MSPRAVIAAALLVACYAVWSAEKIELYLRGDDLGRHLKNGELILSSATPPGTVTRLLHTNFYSYATPDFEFVNHHWLAGVVYFVVWKAAGFAGLNAFYVLLGSLAFLLPFRMAGRAAGWTMAAALALPMMPILRLHPSVRPEVFTLLFCSVFLWLLWNHKSWRTLLWLPAIEIVWVNLHIGFIFGPVFVGAFLLEELLRRGPSLPRGVNPWQTEFYKQKAALLTRWLGILALTALATLLNPSGIYGAIYPFTIWSNYGIDVIENHSVPYLEAHGFQHEYLLIKLILIVLYLSFFVAWRRAAKFPIALFILAIVLGAMAWFAIRNQTILAMFALAAIGINAGLSGIRWRTPVLAILIGAGLSYNGAKLWAMRDTIGLGMYPGVSAAADFLRASNLPGPVLNNFNIGGYLTHYLYPQYRVYVDSRPEAYPAVFLDENYQQPLNNEDQWARLLAEYRFNVLFFSAASTWENAFFARRSRDPEWAAVFAQAPIAILVRRTPGNQTFIREHEISRDSLFRK